MVKLDFIPIDYDYFDFEGRNYVKIIGRNKSGKRICVIDSCNIFLWAILKDKLSKSKIDKLIKEISKIKLDIKGRQTKVEKIELLNKNFLGKPVKALKIYATNYKDLHDIADRLGMPEIINRRGYDLGYITHYIMEKKLLPLTWYEIQGEMLDDTNELGGIAKSQNVDLCIKLNSFEPITEKSFEPKILCYDIECDELKIGKGEILMVSLISRNFKKVITWKTEKEKKSHLPYVEYVKNEKELIEKFIEYVKKISPDFLIGYFSDGFDLPYLKERANKHKIRLALGLDNSLPRFSRGGIFGLTAKTKGIVHIDLFKFIRTAYSQYMKSETLTLDEVAKEFLGERKKEFNHTHSSNLGHKEWQKYYEYNLHDSFLVYKLFEKVWPDLLAFSKIMKEPIHNTSRNGMSSNVESYLLHNLEKFNEIPEKRPTYDEISQRRRMRAYKGAFVLEPTPGLYENIVMFDFTSSYGSTIVTYNLSKSTLLENEPFKKVPKRGDGKNSNSIEIDNKKIHFSKKPGFFPEMLKYIIEQRKKFKKELKAKPDVIKRARSNAYKLLANSSYGYQGFFGARYYCREAAAATAAFARKLIKEVIKKIDKNSYKTIYSDTDSIAFLRNNKSESEVLKFLKEINSELPGIMELELEDFFKRGIWVTTRAGKTGAKKKYALLEKNNKIKIRGFETVRRDWCRLSRQVQDYILRQILLDGNEKNSLEYLKNIVKKIKQRKIDKEKLIIRTQLKKPISEYKAISPHVIAAKKMQEQEIPVTQGNLIEYYIAETIEKKKLVRDKVKLPHEPGEYNIEYYLNRQILPAVENIFQVFDINIKEIIEGKKQTTLESFK